jgi:hypothetical protein
MPLDVAALQRGLEQFLEAFESLPIIPRLPAQISWPRLLVAATAAALGGAMARYLFRPVRRADEFSLDPDDPSASWPSWRTAPLPKDRT